MIVSQISEVKLAAPVPYLEREIICQLTTMSTFIFFAAKHLKWNRDSYVVRSFKNKVPRILDFKIIP